MSLSVLTASPGDLLATHFSREKRMFCISKTVFPLNFCDYSLSSPFLSQLKLTQTPFLHHFFSNLQERVWVFSVSLHFPCFESTFLVSISILGSLWFCQCHTHSRVSFILVIVHCLRVSVFDFVTDVCMMSGVCALFHDSGYVIHIMFLVFYHIICHLNPCNTQWPLDSEVLMFISIIACLFHLLCPCCLWLLVSNLNFFFFLSEISLFHILIPESNQTDVCALWYCIWLFAMWLVYCRWLVVLLKAKTLCPVINQLRLLNGLDYHLNHLKTPIVRGLELLLTHTSTQASLTGLLL